MKESKALPKLVITDIDGVWTDGGMYYDQTGNEWKKFNTSDSAGVNFLRHLQIPLAVVTGEDTAIMQRRAKKLGITHLFMGVKNKVQVAEELCAKLDIEMSDVAFIGDDINDLQLLQQVGFAATPNNAPDYIKSAVHYVVPVNGGDGAFRAFVEHILKQHELLEVCVQALAAKTS